MRVLGSVRRGGHLLHGLDLDFRRAELPRTTCAWDFTGEAGDYAVELAPGAYIVLDGDGGLLAHCEVPALQHFRLDLDL